MDQLLGDAPSHKDLTGEHFGKYVVKRKLGEGGMGAVFEAEHEDVGQRAAVKVLHAEFSREPRFVQRFLAEARAVSLVNHPGLVKLYDCNQLPDGTVYLLMEFLEGQSLAERMEALNKEGKRMSHPEAIRLTRQIASALHAVHQKGVVHRDLKPENIILVQDPETATERPKILDFGVAKMDGGGKKTTVGMILGTPAYMAPEQCEGRPDVGDRVDVYALGLILYELLAGGPPFDGETGTAVMMKHLTRPPPPLPSTVSRSVAELAMTMLVKDPAERPSMEQVLAAIDRLDRNLIATQQELKTLNVAALPARPGPSRRVLIGAGLGAALLLGAAGIGLWSGGHGGHGGPGPALSRPPVVHAPPPPPPAPVAAPAPAEPPAKESPEAQIAKKEPKLTVQHTDEESGKPSRKTRRPGRSHVQLFR